MSNYDIAIVVDAATLNLGMDGLFANSTAQQKLFQGTTTVQGTTITWKFQNAPQFTLAPPSDADWQSSSYVPSGTHPTGSPSAQIFQVAVTSLEVASGGGQAVPFDLAIYAEVSTASQQIVLGNVAMLPSNPNGLADLPLEIAAAAAYAQVQAILGGYQMPASIAIQGQSYSGPVVTITGGSLVVATTLAANGSPVSISDVTWPQTSLGVLFSRSLFGTLLNQYTGSLTQSFDNKQYPYSGSDLAGSYSFDGSLTNVQVVPATTMPDITISAVLSATLTVNLSWWAVPAGCAMGAASNLLPSS